MYEMDNLGWNGQNEEYILKTYLKFKNATQSCGQQTWHL